MSYSSSIVVRGAVIGLVWLSAVSVLSQNFRPGRPALPVIQLPAVVQGHAAVLALGEHLPGVAHHYGVSPEKLEAR